MTSWIVSSLWVFDFALLVFVPISIVPAMLIEKRPGWLRFLCDNALAATLAIGFGVWCSSTDVQVAGFSLSQVNIFGLVLAGISAMGLGVNIAEHVVDVRHGEVRTKTKWFRRLPPEEVRLGQAFFIIILACSFAAHVTGRAIVDAGVIAGRLVPAEQRSMMAVVQAQFAVLFTFGATLLIFYVMTRGRLPVQGSTFARWSARGMLGRMGEAIDEFASSVSKVRLVVRGAAFLVAAVIFWRTGSWWWSNYVTAGTIFEMIGYVIYGVAIVCAGKAAFELLMALKNSDPPKAGAKLGNAKVANNDAARAAARGGGDTPPWAGHGYRD